MPKISIIIPVYNVAPYLRQCLDSVINQTFKDIEIICIDDGSTDNSPQILKEYAAKDDRFVIIEQQNQGAGAARNKGLEIARGEFVFFMDSDDFYYDKNVLKKLYNGAKDKEVMICGGSSVELREWKKTKPRKTGFRFGKNSVVDFNDYQFIYGYWRFIYNLKFLKENNLNFPNYRRFQDPIFFLKAMHKAQKFYAIKDTVYVYRIIPRGKECLTPIITDLVHGMKDVLDYAQQNKLDKVYEDLKNRILTDYSLRFQYIEIDEKDCFNYLFDIPTLSDEQLDNINEYFDKNVLIAKVQGREYLSYLFKNIEDYKSRTRRADMLLIWGWKMHKGPSKIMEYAIDKNVPLVRVEDGFLRSADTWANTKVNKKYTQGVSFTFTNDVFHFDAMQSSYMERQINNPEFKITEDERIRVRKAINYIVENHLTKYNHQPIYTPSIGREGVSKILVVDQSYGDSSISRGLADDDTFKEMLDAAIKENPNADIIVKTHPDALAPGSKRALGYYSTLEPHDNIYVLREPINPISLLQYVDKVYVCTTQLGFEALLCGKEVHTFGMPFYAGWGLTIDKQKCKRRTVKRTLEELFYIIYIKNTHYVDPENKCICSIERAMEYLIELRDEYKNNPIPPVKEKKDISLTKKIFSITKDEEHKIITILGLKIKFKRKINPQKQKKLCNAINKLIPQPSLKSIVYHLADHCNLGCWGCDHFSPLAKENYADIKVFESDIKQLSKLLKQELKIIKLMGGEPLLNKQINEFMCVARKYFPNTRIEIVTNGMLLGSQKEDFWKCCNKQNVVIVITKYPIKIDYKKIYNIAVSYNVNIEFYGKTGKVVKDSYHIPLDVEGKQNQAKNFINCFHANNCVMLKQGKIYPCTVAPNIEHFNKYFGFNLSLGKNDGLNIHEAQSGQEILNYLAKPMEFCKYCAVADRSFGHKWCLSNKDINEWTIQKEYNAE